MDEQLGQAAQPMQAQTLPLVPRKQNVPDFSRPLAADDPVFAEYGAPGAEYIPVHRAENPGEAATNAAVASTKGMVGGLAGLVGWAGRAVGAEGIGKWGEETQQSWAKKAAAWQQPVGSTFSELGTDSSVRDYMNFAAGTLGSFVPWLVPTTGMAKVGGVAGKLLGATRAERLLAREATADRALTGAPPAKLVADTVAKVGRAENAGAMAGMAGAMAAPEIGTLHGENVAEGRTNQLGKELGYGAAIGALQAVVPGAVMARYAGKLAPGARNLALQSVGAGAAPLVGAGVLRQAAHEQDLSEPGVAERLFDPSRMAEEAVTGALGVGLMGAPHAVYRNVLDRSIAKADAHRAEYMAARAEEAEEAAAAQAQAAQAEREAAQARKLRPVQNEDPLYVGAPDASGIGPAYGSLEQAVAGQEVRTAVPAPAPLEPAAQAALDRRIKELENFFTKVDREGVPANVTKELERQARANGLEPAKDSAPLELIAALRDIQAERTRQPLPVEPNAAAPTEAAASATSESPALAPSEPSIGPNIEPSATLRPDQQPGGSNEPHVSARPQTVKEDMRTSQETRPAEPIPSQAEEVSNLQVHHASAEATSVSPEYGVEGAEVGVRNNADQAEPAVAQQDAGRVAPEPVPSAVPVDGQAAPSDAETLRPGIEGEAAPALRPESPDTPQGGTLGAGKTGPLAEGTTAAQADAAQALAGSASRKESLSKILTPEQEAPIIEEMAQAGPLPADRIARIRAVARAVGRAYGSAAELSLHANHTATAKIADAIEARHAELNPPKASAERSAEPPAPLESVGTAPVRRTVEEARGELAPAFGGWSGLKRAERSGLVEVVDAAGPEAANRPEGQAATYDLKTGKIRVWSDAESPVAEALHEGLHGGDEITLHLAQPGLRAQLTRQAERGDRAAQAAIDAANEALRNRQANGGLPEGMTPARFLDKEAPAYYVRDAQIRAGETPTGVLGRMLGATKAAFWSTTFGQKLSKGPLHIKLDDATALALAKRSLRDTMERNDLIQTYNERAGEPRNANQIESAEPLYAGSSPQPEGRQGGGDQAIGGAGLRGRGQGEGSESPAGTRETPRAQAEEEVARSGIAGQVSPDVLESTGAGAAAADPRLAEWQAAASELVSRDKTLKTKITEWVKRQVAPGGNLETYGPGTYREIKHSEAAKSSGETEVANITREMRKAIVADFGVKHYRDIPPDTRREIQAALGGDAAALKALEAKHDTHFLVTVARADIDRSSATYVGQMVEREAELTGLISRMEAAASALSGPALGSHNARIARLRADLEAKQTLRDVIENNYGSYLNAMYRAWNEKDWWQSAQAQAAMPDAFKALADEHGMDTATAKEWINTRLKNGTAYDTIFDFIRSGKLGAADVSILVKKKDLAPWVKALLGEINDDPALTYAATASKLNNLVFNTALQTNLKRIGLEGGFLMPPDAFTTPGQPIHKDLTHEIQGDKGYQDLAGYYAHPEWVQAMQDMLPPIMQDGAYKTFLRAVSQVKVSKTVLSPFPTGVRNYLSGTFMNLAGGDINGKGMSKAFDVWREQVLRQGEVSSEADILARHLSAAGILGDSVYAREFAERLKESRIFTKITADKGGAIWKDKARDFGRDTMDWFQRFYAFGDDGPKIVAYFSKYAQLEKAIGAKVAAKWESASRSAERVWEDPAFGSVRLRGPEPGKVTAATARWEFVDQYGTNVDSALRSWDTETAARAHASDILTRWDLTQEVSRRIKETYPNYSMVGAGIKQLGRWPLTGTFVSFPAEMLRTTFGMARQIHRDMQDPALRPLAIRQAAGLAMAASLSGAISLALKNAFGISNEEDRASRELLGDWMAIDTLWATGRDRDGKPQFISSAMFDPYAISKVPVLALLRAWDRPWDEQREIVQRAIGELALPFVGMDITTKTLTEMLRNERGGLTGGQGKIWDETDSVPTILAKEANYLLHAVMPTTLRQSERVLQAAQGYTARDGRRLDLRTELSGLFVGKATPADPETGLYRYNFQFQLARNGLLASLSRAISDPNAIDPADLRSTFDATASARHALYTELLRKVNAARTLGLTPVQTGQILRRLGISAAERSALLRNEVPRWTLSASILSGTEKKGQTLYTPAQSAEISKRRRDVLSWIREAQP